jgi:hypothetical protein
VGHLSRPLIIPLAGQSAVQNGSSTLPQDPADHEALDEEEIVNNAATSTTGAADTSFSLHDSDLAADEKFESPYTWETRQPKHLPQEPHLLMLSTLSQVGSS